MPTLPTSVDHHPTRDEDRIAARSSVVHGPRRPDTQPGAQEHGPGAAKAGPPPEVRSITGIGAALVAAVVVFVMLFQWNWLRGPLAGYLSHRLNREVAITGDLKVHPWSLQPRATVNGLVIGNPRWAGREPMARLPRLTVQVELLRLLRGQVVLPLVEVTRPNVHLIRDAQDRANWTFGEPNRRAEPLRLPAIRHFVIDDGRLRLNDARRHATFVGTVTSNERSSGANRGVFTLQGQGTLNRSPFYAHVVGAPMLHVSPDTPYPFTAQVQAGQTHITARGVIPRPFDFGAFTTSLAIRGPNAADLYYLTGLTLPNTPPYQVSGGFERDGRRYYYRRFSGRVGDSDLSGNLQVDTRRRPAMVEATLASRHLDFDDLASLFGGPPAVGRGETASPQQVAEARALRAQGRLLPDARLDTSRLSAMNADVHYRAASVSDGPIPVRAMSLRLQLQDRVLTASPLSLTLPQGAVTGLVRLNGRGATPVTDLDLRLTGGRVQDFLPAGVRRNISGGLVARARLTGTGPSVRTAAATANGQVSVVMPRGQMNEAMAELMGINLTRGLLLRWNHSRSTTPVRCGVANFHASNGVLTSNRLVLATDSAVVRGGGTINLRNETLNLRVQGRATHFRLVRVRAPLTLTGSFSHPRGGVELGQAAPQVGIAAVLAAVVHPLAAILPFVDPGLGNDANCSALIAGANTGSRR
jgi:uncharacterized protein involved in outer membrane biogenesis